MRLAILTAAASLAGSATVAEQICRGYGPQAPRDISRAAGRNPVDFGAAPPAEEMALCNIHVHRSAEHAGPGFSTAASDGSGYVCDGAAGAERAERETGAHEIFGAVTAGDTVEMHWVYSSCEVEPGPALDACASAECVNPTLRVEAQVFRLTDDPAAHDMADFALGETGARPQPKSLPAGEAVEFAGSTTGPSYSRQACSPYQVTWAVRPGCADLSLASLREWGATSVFEATEAHGVRDLVTAPELLAPIE